MPRYKLKDRTYYNETPITDVYEALDVLCFESSSRRSIHLFKSIDKDNPDYHLVVPWYREGCSGGDTSGEDYYQIDPTLAQKMIDEGLVTPLKIVSWGRTDTDRERFVVCYDGEEKSKAYDRDMIKKAESMLKPGIHTDLTAKPYRTEYGREGFRHGRFYVEFKTPHNERCRVYPQDDELVFPYVYKP